VLAGVLAGCVVCGLWLGVARAGLARQRAEAAADQAALAAARSVAGFIGSPCAAATTIAAENGARLVTCLVADETVDVTVAVSSPMPATGHARAGPAAAQ
jgi:secretion/DNA translocation related TadE-like protein